MSATIEGMSTRISARIAAISESATLAVDAKAKALKAAGRPVIGFGAGEPDFPTPPHIVEAAVAACSDPVNHHYTPAAGLPALRAAIAEKTLRDSGLACEPSQVLVTNGGKQAVYNAFQALLDPGDEVLLPAPFWTTYPESIALADGVPVVLPTAYGREGDTLYLHGSSANGAFGAAAGQQVCVTVTHMDGIVCARSVFSHSVNYRSAVVFGTATLVRDEDERWQALRLITDHLIPGRWAAARQPTRKEMAATAVLSLPLTEASVKVRTGMPADEPEDYDLDVWAGVLPMALTFGQPQPDPAMRPEIPLPAHIRDRASS
jgi:nitroimidazol reductase NimA-like FMN-containing flavoprotein (pyridoxamine 5'-phosphate oxidase superfamily)